jgi:TolA-binding protein
MYLKVAKAKDRDMIAYRIADIYEKRFGKIAYAIKEYEKFIADYPLSESLDDAQFAIGRCYEKLNDYAAALAAFERLIENYPSSGYVPETRKRIEYISNYLRKDYSGAIEKFVSLTIYDEQEKSPEQRYFIIADIFEYQLKDFGKAISVLETCREKYPNSAHLAFLAFRLGQLYEKMSRKAVLEANGPLGKRYREKALGIYRTIIKAYPADTLVDDIKYKLLNAENAPVSQYEQFLADYPSSNKFPEVCYSVAKTYHDRLKKKDEKQIGKVVAQYSKAAAFDSRSPIVPQAYFGMAQCYLFGENYKAAKRQLLDIIKQYPDHALNPECYYTLGEIHYQQEDYKGALKYYKKIVYKYPFSAFTEKSELRTAECLYLSRQITAALKQYRSFLANYSKSRFAPSAKYGMGRCFEYLDKHESALREYISLEEEYSDWEKISEVRITTAGLYRKTGRMKLAADYFRKVLDRKKADPQTRAYHFNLAETLYDLKNHTEAKKYYTRFLKHAATSGDSVKGFTGLICSQTILGQTRQAKKLKAQFKDQYPGQKAALAKMVYTEGIYLLNRGSYKKAEKRFAYLIKKYSRTEFLGQAKYQLGVCRYYRKENTEALDIFKKFIKDFPGHQLTHEARFRIGIVYTDLNDYANAADYFKAIAYSQDVSQKLLDRACFSAVTAFEKIAAWKKGYEMQQYLLNKTAPEKASTRMLIKAGFLSTKLNDYATALTWFKKAMTKAQPDEMAETAYWIAKSYSMTGEEQKAILEYLKIPFLYKDFGMWASTAELEAAALYERIGDTGNAKKLYEKIIRSDGADGKFGKMASARLKEIETLSGKSKIKDKK